MTTMPPTPPMPPVPSGYVELNQPAPPAWPTVIGIIAIVFGALATIGSCVAGVGTAMLGPLVEMVPEGQDGGLRAMLEYQPMLIAIQVGSLLVALLLLIGGINLVRRAPLAVKLCVTWALVKIVVVLGNSFLGYAVQKANIEAMEEQMANDPNAPALPGGFFEAMGLAGVVIGVAWGWALPIFLLVWFSRPSVKAHVAEWGGANDPYEPGAM